MTQKLLNVYNKKELSLLSNFKSKMKILLQKIYCINLTLNETF